jgi:dipeptidyl aminopeptidase/acylaminoacyl peptidase
MKVLCCALIVMLGASQSWAARAFRVEDMQGLARVGGVRLSPDGRWVAFTVTRSDVAKNASVTNVWMVPSGGGAVRQLTFAESGSNADPRWSPDSRLLYFVSTRAGSKRQLFRLPIGGGEAMAISQLPTGVDSYVPSPDGKTIALISNVFPGCADMPCHEKQAKQRDENPVKVRVITDVPFRRWDSWVDGRRNHILIVPAEGGDAKDVTPGDADSPVWTEGGGEEVAISSDGRELCFSRFSENESLTGNSDLYVMPITGGTPRAITTNKGADRGPVYSPDGRYIAYGATLRSADEADLTRLFIYERQTGLSRNASEAVDRSIDSYVWSADSNSLYVTFEDRGQVTVARLDASTLKLTPLFTTGTSSNVEASADGSFLVFSNTDFAHPSELFRLDLTASGPRRATPLTRMNADRLRDIEFGESSSFTYAGWNGEQVQAWQVKPPAFDPARKYPLLLLMHGGPHGAWLNQFHYRWNAHLFAAAGYVVILPNFHGSSGFGLTFIDSIKGQWGGAPYEDQMRAVDVALTWPYVDPTRIAAAGASYGGYMANWMEGHTDRFRTIVSHDGLYDLVTMLYSTDFLAWTVPELKGTPWNNQQALIDQAPSTYARNFKTPMLIIHGERDYRVDPSQALAMFQVLQAMRVPSKLVLFTEENHWVVKPADNIFWYHTVLEWIDEWTRPERGEYEKRLQAARASSVRPE